jgi:Asp-tRNA(Asn)/Glu-tRNA(Gln) amidotransferase A subunit family amidase
MLCHHQQDQALEQSKNIDFDKPLAGIPIAIKEIFVSKEFAPQLLPNY